MIPLIGPGGKPLGMVAMKAARFLMAVEMRFV
jgi:hypothetical protein